MKLFDVYPLYDISIVRAEGSYVWDDKGTRYLDMYGGHAVISIGHSNPVYVDAVSGQLHRIGFYSNSVVIEEQRVLAEKFGKLTGKDDYQLFLINSGAEANENAIKLASFHNGRTKAVAFSGSFHGRTSLAVAATDNPSIVAPINRTDNVIFLPFNDVPALEELFAARGSEISSVIFEGIQGVGGIRVASDDFIRAIRRLCDVHGALMIADEVQCGCGRSGRYYFTDWVGVNVDIYTMAKGIGNGFPVGAVCIAPHIAPKYSMLGTTFGGNQLACAAMTAVAEVMQQEALVSNAAQVGDYLLDRLNRMAFDNPDKIREIRGCGLMIGIDMVQDCTALRKAMLHDAHIFTGSSGKTVIRLLPALNITRAHADMFLTEFEKLLTHAC